MVNLFKIGIIGGGIGIVAFFVVIFFAIERPAPEQLELKDIIFSIKDLELRNIDNNETIARITFSLTNPNPRTIILESIDYEIFADGVRVAADGVGERLERGIVGATGGTFTLIAGSVVDIHDDALIEKKGYDEEFWSNLQSNNVKWRVKGSYVITDPQRESGKEYTFDTNL